MKRVFLTTIAFVSGCGIVVGAFIAYTFLPPASGVLSSLQVESEYPVTLTEYSDQRVLPLAPVLADGAVLRTSAGGTVTKSACVPGAAIGNGVVAFALDARPVVAVVSDQPFYRDLAWGDSGADVDALRRALIALGYNVSDTGSFDSGLAGALKDLQAQSGSASTDGIFRLADFLWVPAGDARIATCDVKIGQLYSSGETFATTESALRSLHLVQSSALSVVSGDRQISVFGVEVTLPESGVIDDPQTISEIVSSPEFDTQLTSGSTTSTISGSSKLSDPLQVAAIPPVSVFGIEGDRGCVTSAEGVHQVTIVGANMGMSLVTFDSGPPMSVLLSENEEPCGDN